MELASSRRACFYMITFSSPITIFSGSFLVGPNGGFFWPGITFFGPSFPIVFPPSAKGRHGGPFAPFTPFEPFEMAISS